MNNDYGNDYGYVRVSTKKQNEDRQLVALQECGIKPENIFVDKQSGKDFNRPAYRRLMKKIKSGDTIFIKSIDRLGRNYEEIIEQWRMITKERKACIVVIDMPLLDTRRKDKDLTGVFVADLVLQILSYVAQTEREYNRQRQAEGIAVAQAKGVRFGRPALKRPEDFTSLHEAWKRKEISARLAAKKLGITHRTFLSWVGGGV
ncbi:MAG: recombinase family protein [Clostridiales Family XIII bacterium]|jgi:DNA invertase Pin-like site-specific DNA recombinase|nr:recombinase family protein [Clostridiales Family XIII bacterium]